MEKIIVGIDVSKDRLDVAVRPPECKIGSAIRGNVVPLTGVVHRHYLLPPMDLCVLSGTDRKPGRVR